MSAPARPPPSQRALIEVDRALESGAVSVDRAVREAYARDESEATPVVPSAVIRVRDTASVARVMEVARRHDVAVTPRAGGTGRVGGAVPQTEGWVLAFEGFQGIEEVDPGDRIVVARPGVVLGALHEAVEREGLFYPPDPSSLASCTIGGNLATNAGGPRACKYGVTGDYALGMEVVLADGTVLELGRRTKKGVTGYDLTSLIVGSEGTLALITRATLRLVNLPEAVRTLLVYFDDLEATARTVAALLARPSPPRALELFDETTLEIVRASRALAIPPSAQAMLLVELDGDGPALDRELAALEALLEDRRASQVDVAVAPHERERLWAVRRDMSRALRKRKRHKLSEDVVVPLSRIGAFLTRTREIAAREGCLMPTYGHAGDGNFHVNFLYDDEEERDRVDRAIQALFEDVVQLGGTLSGEHGIGVLKAPYLGIEQSDALIATQRRLKASLDPTGILNPLKIFPHGHGDC